MALSMAFLFNENCLVPQSCHHDSNGPQMSTVGHRRAPSFLITHILLLLKMPTQTRGWFKILQYWEGQIGY